MGVNGRMKITVFSRRSERGLAVQTSDLFSEYTDVDSVFFENGFLHMTRANGKSCRVSAHVTDSWEQEES